jgi:hypothetical protein
MPNFARNIIEVRMQVGFLGEANQYNWWSSNFVAPTSNAFLSPVFKRTGLLAKYNGVCEAARRVHDERIGIGDVAHLFRLPEPLEFRLSQTLGDALDEETFGGALQSIQAATDALSALCGTSNKAVEGPINIDPDVSIMSREWLLEAVSHYVSAFSRGTNCYPYFYIRQ